MFIFFKKINILVPVCFSLKKQKEAEAMEVKKSALNDSSNEMSDDDYKKDTSKKIDQNASKTTKTLKKNPLQNTARLGIILSFQNKQNVIILLFYLS